MTNDLFLDSVIFHKFLFLSFLTFLLSSFCRLDILFFYHPYLLPLNAWNNLYDVNDTFHFLDYIFVEIYYLNFLFEPQLKFISHPKTINSHLFFILMTIIKFISMFRNFNVFLLYRDLEFSQQQQELLSFFFRYWKILFITYIRVS